jgi:hypothetical protein
MVRYEDGDSKWVADNGGIKCVGREPEGTKRPKEMPNLDLERSGGRIDAPWCKTLQNTAKHVNKATTRARNLKRVNALPYPGEKRERHMS